MVRLGRPLGRRGMGRTGCLLWVLVFVSAGYFGVEIGTIYIRKWRMEDEIKTQVAFAPSLTDETIRRRLLNKVDELQLPPEARQISISRTVRPSEIRIVMSYPEVLQLPFSPRIIRFRLDIRQRL